jgi:hypothetical protein
MQTLRALPSLPRRRRLHRAHRALKPINKNETQTHTRMKRMFCEKGSKRNYKNTTLAPIQMGFDGIKITSQ